MKASAFVLGVGLGVLGGCSEGPDARQAQQQPATAAPPAAVEGAPTLTRVIAYYFHGTIRCETCLKIEKQAREAMETRFPVEMLEKRLVFKPVNYDKPENAHFLKDYKLPCPSLVVVRQRGGKDEKWKLLERTWDLVQVPPQLDQYIEEETRKVLEVPK